jgi:hypothetical protein
VCSGLPRARRNTRNTNVSVSSPVAWDRFCKASNNDSGISHDRVGIRFTTLAQHWARSVLSRCRIFLQHDRDNPANSSMLVRRDYSGNSSFLLYPAANFCRITQMASSKLWHSYSPDPCRRINRKNLVTVQPVRRDLSKQSRNASRGKATCGVRRWIRQENQASRSDSLRPFLDCIVFARLLYLGPNFRGRQVWRPRVHS